MSDPVIDLVRELGANPKAGPALFAQHLESRFHRLDEQSNPSFDVLRSNSPVRGGLVSGIEMRVRRANGLVKLLIVSVDVNKHCLKEAAVTQAFGKNFAFTPPSPRAPPAAPTYYSYVVGNHKVSFGFDQNKKNCFTKIVLEFDN
ncbi:hypothetical protein IP69_01885 [Bosea sp. AAP35]|uniref:hypothetical protein n=1 Tax=Bosea sp. AAP35 TaxID=1523417 RepID=UPI0006B94E44|nr:hypothetical protein [Bosea sp. AAP35]KPF72657.1 hypothetical protein IP69_01885 [Bosea sp. AAP35]